MINRIIEKSKAYGFDDVEIIEMASNETSISLFKGNVEKNFRGESKTYYIIGFMNKMKTMIKLEKGNEDLTDKEINGLLKKLKDNIVHLETPEESFIYAGSNSYEKVEEEETNFENVSTNKKIKLLENITKKAYEYDERIELVSECEYLEEKHFTHIVNSKGLDLKKENAFCGVVVGAVAAEKGNENKQDSYDIEVTKDFNKIDVKKIINESAGRAVKLVGAEPIESGVYDVIVESNTMASLLKGFVSMFSGKMALRGLSGLVGKLGTKVMCDKVSIVDDPLCKEALKKDAFDLEGVATYKKYLVKNGEFKTFLHNLQTGKAMGVESTGNASLDDVVPMNLYIEKGELSKEQLIKKVKKGLLITGLAGLHASLNPISGDFSAQATGFYIENGKIVKPTTLIVIAGNFLKMMSSIEEIGSDLKFGYGNIFSPSILFNNIVVSGK